jgi:hypothetical protein
MLFNHFTFGTSSPVSGQIKRWWGSMASSAYEQPASDWTSYFGVSSGHSFKAWKPFIDIFRQPANLLYFVNPGGDVANKNFYLAIILFLLIVFILLLLNKKKIPYILKQLSFIPVMAGSGIHVLSYTTTAYSGIHEWYWVNQIILLTIFFSLLIYLILEPLHKILLTSHLLDLVALFIAVNTAYQFWIPIKTTMVHNVFPIDKPYMDVVRYLEQNTLPNEIIGMTGGGNVGYFIKGRTIVNMDGLINSYEYFQALQNGQSPIYLREHGMTVIFASPRLLAIPPYFGQFAPYLERFNSYGGKDLLYLLEEPKY